MQNRKGVGKLHHTNEEWSSEFLSDAPAFSAATQGYNMQQVDEYIDKIRTENDTLSEVNQQLFLLWVQQLRGIAEHGGEIPAMTETGDNTLSWQKIDDLMRASYSPEKLERMLERIAKPSFPTEEQILEEPPVPRRTRIKSAVFGAFFYIGLIVAVLLVYMFAPADQTGPPRSIGGFSAMTVLTRSMQDDIPQHSLVITRRVAPESIQIGDDITYLLRNNTTVTHRVVGIYPNYAGTGMPGFRTQGTMNERPDSEVVSAINLVGLVVFSNLSLGLALLFIRTNVLFVAMIAAMGMLSFILLRKFVFPPKQGQK